MGPLAQPSPGKRIWNVFWCSLPWLNLVFCWIFMCTQISWGSYYRFGFSRCGWGLSVCMAHKLAGSTCDDPPWVGRLLGMFSCGPSVMNTTCVLHLLREDLRRSFTLEGASLSCYYQPVPSFHFLCFCLYVTSIAPCFLLTLFCVCESGLLPFMSLSLSESLLDSRTHRIWLCLLLPSLGRSIWTEVSHQTTSIAIGPPWIAAFASGSGL